MVRNLASILDVCLCVFEVSSLEVVLGVGEVCRVLK